MAEKKQPLFGIAGGGSWATALAKILTDNRHSILWWMRNEEQLNYIRQRGHNPRYLSSIRFDLSHLRLYTNLSQMVKDCDVLVVAIPSAFVADTLQPFSKEDWQNKKILSAIKGLIPKQNLLLNEFLTEKFGIELKNYFAVLGPCHSEEIAAEKLSYLTFSGLDAGTASTLASFFETHYVNTIVNDDIYGVQYAAVLKNIYAVCAGIAHGMEYGDNFLSVLIANAADEMAGFLKKAGARHIMVGEHESEDDPITHRKSPNYAASVYLGDLLVTCYSPHSRNRCLGNMIGKGYSVTSALMEMKMVAEGYHASRCIYEINNNIKAAIPIAETVYQILWENLNPREGFKLIEKVLV
ncbi:MAG: NAD(P)-binding domain-containing protein [Chitinophagaceae bacterium]|nr:NAD(P)-binding domain-containing protein [Chitinophagaceae bacterium]